VSIRSLALAGLATGAMIGIIAGLAGWSDADIQFVGAIGTILGGALFIALPDTLSRR